MADAQAQPVGNRARNRGARLFGIGIAQAPKPRNLTIQLNCNSAPNRALMQFTHKTVGTGLAQFQSNSLETRPFPRKTVNG